ncbi:hypothetical protein GCM10010430_68390 [Kitasatospora cystarginea]|uniref:Uncharacterized protein n=2 Tax=Kitasatospora cystarginea TaxID=58350 RepID=A0ABP5RVB3_9ACTN
MTPKQGGRTTGGCARDLAALVLATAGTLYGHTRVVSAWHRCMSQDHEPYPNLLTAPTLVWVVMLTVLLVLATLLDPLSGSRWYLWPAMAAVAAVLTWLYVLGMVHPAPLQPGDPSDAACRTVPIFPFTG